MGRWQAQGLVRTSEVIIGTQPLDVPGEAGLATRQGPGAAAERRDQLAQGQVKTFDLGGHDESAQAQRLQGLTQLARGAAQGDGI